MRAGYKVVTATDTDTGFKTVYGWSAQEVNGTPAATVIYLTNASGGDKLVRIELAANESANMSYGSAPLSFPNNCFVTLTAGTGEITVYGSP